MTDRTIDDDMTLEAWRYFSDMLTDQTYGELTHSLERIAMSPVCGADARYLLTCDLNDVQRVLTGLVTGDPLGQASDRGIAASILVLIDTIEPYWAGRVLFELSKGVTTCADAARALTQHANQHGFQATLTTIRHQLHQQMLDNPLPSTTPLFDAMLAEGNQR